MEKEPKPWRKDALIQLIFYAVGISLIVFLHWISPTNLAGFGLDLPMFLIVVIGSLIMLGRVITKFAASKSYTLSLLINLIGITFLVLMVVLPADSW